MAKSCIISLLAALIALQVLACQAAELNEAAKEELKEATDSKPEVEAPAVAMPVLLLRGKDEKPDFFLIWMKPYEQVIPKPMLDMIDSQIRPQTEQMSGQIISNVPGAEQAWSQMSQVQNIISQLGLANMMGGGGSGSGSGSNPLASLMENFAGRRR